MLKILCVEDDPADREALRNYGEIIGWRIEFAHSCADGLKLALAAPYDVMVIDINMPDFSGLELIEKLRSTGGPNQSTPIMIYSGAVSGSIRMIAQSLKVETIVLKPMLLTNFKDKIRKLTR